MPQKYLNVDGVATLIHHRGPTTLPGQPPTTDRGETIVCLHDAGSCGTQFADLLDELATDHSPLSYDQPGHGRSAGLDSLGSIEAMAGHLTTLLANWSLTDVVLVGEGLGTAVALDAARRNADSIKALVLTGGAAPSWDLAEEIDQLDAIASGRARREFDRTGYGPDADRSVYEKAFGAWVTTDPRATLGDRQAQAEWSLADDSMSAIPTLVVVGEHEEPSSAAAARTLAESLPNGHVHELSGAGRRGVLEQPGALAAAIGTFAAPVATEGDR